MRDKPSNLDKRALFDLLRNPERVGRALGRAVRALQEELNPPTVSEEEYRAAVEQVDALETQVKELEERHEADQENIRQLVQQIAEQDKKLNEILDRLEQSSSQLDKEQIPRWRKLQKRLWVILGTLAGSALFLGEALVDAWVEDQLYPIIKTLPKRAQDAWYELIEGVSGQPASRLESPPSKPTPERLVYHLPPAALTSATGLYASPNGAELIASATLPAGEIVYVIGRNSAGSHLRVVWIIGVGWVPVSFTDFNGRQEKLEPLPILSEPPPGATPITTCYSPNSEWTSRYKQRIAVIVDLIRSRYGEFPPSSLSLTVNGREVEISRRDIVNQGGQFLLMNTGFPLSDDVEPGDKVGFRFKSVSTEQPAFIAIIYRVQPRNLVELHDYSHIFWPIRSGYLFTALPPGLVHFVVKHLREVSGGQITETVSYEDEEALDNRNRTVPLQVPINMTRHYRHRINIRLNSSKVTEYWVRDAIVRLYALPLSDPEGTVREALSAISVVIPAGQRAKITFQWTELWAEGVISEGRDGTGNRLGSFSVFLGYVQPCSLVKQESIP